MAPRATVAGFWRDLERAVQEGKRDAIKAGATVLYTGTLKELASGSPGGGRRYRRGKRRVHVASVAGSAPARDYGTLQRAIGMEILTGRNPSGIVGVKRTAPHGRYLDPGEGEPEPKIGRRPFLSAARRKLDGDIRAAISETLERRLRGLR